MENDCLFNNLVDLHVHLGASSTPHFLWETALEQGIKLPEKVYWKFIDSVTITHRTSHQGYLDYFHLSELIQSSVWAVEKAVHHAISLSYRKANVNLIEIRFNPMLRNRNNEHDLDKIILGALVGMKKACIEYPVKAGLILMMDRRFDKKKNMVIAQKAIKYRHDGVVGLDLGGPLSEQFSMEDVVDAYLLAQQNGLNTTVHTGELTSAQEMMDVIAMINPDRIGHGIRAVDDPKLMKILAKKKTVLELCPTSNFKASAVKDWKEFESIVQTLKKYDVLFTINSDGPVFLQTNCKEEYKKLLKHKIFTEQELRELKKIARKASFVKDTSYIPL